MDFKQNRNLRDASMEELRQMMQELLYELRFRFSGGVNLTDEAGASITIRDGKIELNGMVIINGTEVGNL